MSDRDRFDAWERLCRSRAAVNATEYECRLAQKRGLPIEDRWACMLVAHAEMAVATKAWQDIEVAEFAVAIDRWRP